LPEIATAPKAHRAQAALARQAKTLPPTTAVPAWPRVGMHPTPHTNGMRPARGRRPGESS